jgi:fumarate reductase subunit C
MSTETTGGRRRPYVRDFPTSWWLQKPFYMLREMTSFFVGTYSALLIVGLWRLSEGPAAWTAYIGMFDHWAWLVYHGLALAFALYHTVTWFALFPRTAPIMVKEDFVPPAPLIIGQYVVWLVVSLIVLAALVLL